MPYLSSVWGGYILVEVRQELSTANPILRDRLSFRAAPAPVGGWRRPRPLRPEGAERPKQLSSLRKFLIANGISISHEGWRAL